jgi:DNA (cytosine-5)-methyltransferase 1
MKDITFNEFLDLRERTGLSPEQLSGVLGVSARTIRRWDSGEVEPKKMAVQLMKGLVRKSSLNGTRVKATSPDFTFIDLFAGIGGFRKGFESIGGKCVFTSEWDRYSQKTYRANFDCEHEIAGDITKIEASDIPKHDILVAGFPCQPFSIAGVSKKNSLNRPHGFRCDAQGTLFFDVARIIEHHQPRAFLLENVKNLINHDKGRTFKIIHKTLTEELGYNVHWKVIDARSWVPQHRERIFIAGFRDKNDFSFNNLVIPNPLIGPKIGSILHALDGSEGKDGHFLCKKTGKVSEKYTLSDHLWRYLQDYADKHKAAGNGFGFGLVKSESVARTLSARYYKDGSEILVHQARKNPRRLTPRECARLMGFEKPGEKKFMIPVSDTQAYKQFGNAVVVPVVETVARHMLPWITQEAEVESREKRRA